MGCDDEEYSEEDKGDRIEKEVIKIGDTQKSATDEEIDNASKHEQSSEQATCPAEIINDCMQFHKYLVLVKIKVK